MRLITAEDIEREDQAEVERVTEHNRLVVIRGQAKKRAPKPKCVCGCGKAARWPLAGKAFFYTRKCGYLMALKMFTRKRR